MLVVMGGGMERVFGAGYKAWSQGEGVGSLQLDDVKLLFCPVSAAVGGYGDWPISGCSQSFSPASRREC